MYRLFSTGTAIECDSPQDVAALLAVFSLTPPKGANFLPEPGAAPAPRKNQAKRAIGKRRRAITRSVVTPVSASESTDAGARRELLRGLIGKSDVGLTTGELRARGPKMSDSDRRNALQTLKSKGEIKRAGNAWVAA